MANFPWMCPGACRVCTYPCRSRLQSGSPMRLRSLRNPAQGNLGHHLMLRYQSRRLIGVTSRPQNGNWPERSGGSHSRQLNHSVVSEPPLCATAQRSIRPRITRRLLPYYLFSLPWLHAEGVEYGDAMSGMAVCLLGGRKEGMRPGLETWGAHLWEAYETHLITLLANDLQEWV